MKQAQARNDKILKKHMDENKNLKKGGGSGNSSSAPAKQEALPQKRDFKAMRANKKANAERSIEDFNQKFLADLQGQIDDMFQKVELKKGSPAVAEEGKKEEGEEVKEGENAEVGEI